MSGLEQGMIRALRRVLQGRHEAFLEILNQGIDIFRVWRCQGFPRALPGV